MTVYQFGVVFFLAVGTVGGIHALSSIAARLDRQNNLLERSVRLAEEREAQRKIDGA